MMPSSHVILGFIFSLLLLYIFPSIGFLGFLIIFISSFLIDFDHYLGYVWIKKDWNPINSYKWNVEKAKKFFSMPRSEKDKFYSFLCIFHGIEVLFILLILGSFVSKYFLFIFIGFSFHLALDAIHSFAYDYRLDKMCLIHDHFKFRKLKRIE